MILLYSTSPNVHLSFQLLYMFILLWRQMIESGGIHTAKRLRQSRSSCLMPLWNIMVEILYWTVEAWGFLRQATVDDTSAIEFLWGKTTWSELTIKPTRPVNSEAWSLWSSTHVLNLTQESLTKRIFGAMSDSYALPGSNQTEMWNWKMQWVWVQVKLLVYHQNLKMANKDKLAWIFWSKIFFTFCLLPILYYCLRPY